MKKALSILMAMSLLCAQSLSLCVKAEEVGVTESCTEEPIITAAYLIENEYLYVSNSNGRLYVYGSTTGVCPMASIGIKDIVVERNSLLSRLLLAGDQHGQNDQQVCYSTHHGCYSTHHGCKDTN